jgi:hypothetical protein
VIMSNMLGKVIFIFSAPWILTTVICSSSVNALVWNSVTSVLYVGGRFQSVDNRRLSFGLAEWSVSNGLVSFTGGGVGMESSISGLSEVVDITFDSTTKVSILS